MGQYFLDINANDDLLTVIKKCNTNFKTILTQQQQQSKAGQQEFEEQISHDIGEAVDEVVNLINQEAGYRRSGDDSLSGEIQALRTALANAFTWVEIVNVDTTSAQSFTDRSFNINNYREIFVTDGVDQRIFQKIALPTSQSTYTLDTNKQFKLRIQSSTLSASLAPGAKWKIYAR